MWYTVVYYKASSRYTVIVYCDILCDILNYTTLFCQVWDLFINVEPVKEMLTRWVTTMVSGGRMSLTLLLSPSLLPPQEDTGGDTKDIHLHLQ